MSEGCIELLDRKFDFLPIWVNPFSIKQEINNFQNLIDKGEQERYDLNQFLKNVRKYTAPNELTAEMVKELIYKIIVHAPDKSSGHRKRKIEIYYKTVGIINIATVNERITEDGRKDRLHKESD